MVDRNGSFGGSKIMLLIILVVLVLGGLTAWKFIDARTRIYEFEKGVEDIVINVSFFKDDAAIFDEVEAKAKKARVNVTRDQVQVERRGGMAHITAKFVQDVKTPLFTYKWNVTVERKSGEF